MTKFNVAALFAGIGGIELGLKRSLGENFSTSLFCEFWEPAQAVLKHHFPEVPIHPDVRTLNAFSQEVNLITAGFPCTDLSQAGRTAGISGENSGLVKHLFQALSKNQVRSGLPTLLIENVPNMLVLERGRAMRYLIDELEALGYSWAYRVVDSRFAGVPQRRRRVILLASTQIDPRNVLFADDAGPRSEADFAEDAFGFYWTEGRGGLGWARDAVPTLKGGSTIGIPSPPAIWRPNAEHGLRFVRPNIEDAEEMQGFPRGWTDVHGLGQKKNGPRWKLVGNAVTVGVAEWVGHCLANPRDFAFDAVPWDAPDKSWPAAAWGQAGQVWEIKEISEFPIHADYKHLSSLVEWSAVEPLSLRAASGFWNRLKQGNLGQYPGFRNDVQEHIESMSAA